MDYSYLNADMSMCKFELTVNLEAFNYYRYTVLIILIVTMGMAIEFNASDIPYLPVLQLCYEEKPRIYLEKPSENKKKQLYKMLKSQNQT